MADSRTGDGGFTLVELMVVVLIIGILVSIAVPVYQGAATNAQAKTCQANQRTLVGAVEMFRDTGGSAGGATGGELDSGGSGWLGILVPGWIRNRPLCPLGQTNYLLAASGTVIGDQGTVAGFKAGHGSP